MPTDITRTNAAPPRSRAHATHSAAACLALLLLFLSPAAADYGLIQRLQAPPVTDETIALFERTVEPSTQQLEYAQDLAGVAADEFAAILESWAAVRAGFEREQRREDFSFGRMTEFFTRTSELRTERDAVRERFAGDLALVITRDQRDAFDVFRGRIARDDFYRTALPDVPRLKPYTADLQRVLEQDAPDALASVAVRESLALYTKRSDTLIARLRDALEEEARVSALFEEQFASVEDAATPEGVQEIRDAIAALAPDIRKAEQDVSDAASRLADLHRTTANAIAALDGGQRSDAIIHAYHRAAFPQIHADTTTHDRFRAALALEGLGGARVAIAELFGAFEADTERERAVLRAEALASVPVDGLKGSRYPSPVKTEAASAAQANMRAIEARYAETLAGLLNDDQRTAVFGDTPVDWRRAPIEQ